MQDMFTSATYGVRRWWSGDRVSLGDGTWGSGGRDFGATFSGFVIVMWLFLLKRLKGMYRTDNGYRRRWRGVW